MCKICIGYVGTCSVLPLNAMVDAAPWVHGLCVWASYLPSHCNMCSFNLNLWNSPKKFTGYKSIYLDPILFKASLQILHHIRSALQYWHNIDLCKAFQCFIPLWEGATSSQINSLGSIQVTWQLYPHFCFSLTTWGNLSYCTSYNQVEVWWLDMFWQSTCPSCAPITQTW